MSDLIERQKAIRKLKRMATQAYIDKLNGSAETVINCCIDVIERQIPSAQPEIVRCKDCENWIPGYITDNDDFIPPKCGKYQQMVGHSSDDYCSRAERRTDAGGSGWMK